MRKFLVLLWTVVGWCSSSTFPLPTGWDKDQADVVMGHFNLLGENSILVNGKTAREKDPPSPTWWN